MRTHTPADASANVLPLSAPAPRQMTPADKRKVFREIDESWNEGRSRYTGAVSDQSIALKLDVPRAWVELVRLEAFGANRNEDMDKLLGNLKNLQGEVQRNGEKALALATDYERIAAEIADIKSRIADLG